MKKKSFVAILLAVVMTIVATFALVGCGDDGTYHAPDNSFKGSISEESYDTVDEAAAAFIEEELNGAATTATFVSYEKSSDLTAEEIADLNLGDDFEYSVDQIDSAENGVVSYTEASAAAVLSSATGAKTARLVIIKIGSVYWYYIPLFKDGDVLTNSYMDDILNYEKYRNFTETNVSKTTATAQRESATTTVTVVTKIQDNKIHFKQTAPNAYGTGTEVTEYYFVATEDDGLLMYSGSGSSWYPSSTIYDSMDDFLQAAFKYDASYFIKTTSGFKMNSAKLSQYLNDVLGSLVMTGYNVTDVSADYYVKDARLDSIETTVKMTTKLQNQTVNVTSRGTTTYSDYGTTVVDLPFEI